MANLPIAIIHAYPEVWVSVKTVVCLPAIETCPGSVHAFTQTQLGNDPAPQTAPYPLPLRSILYGQNNKQKCLWMSLWWLTEGGVCDPSVWLTQAGLGTTSWVILLHPPECRINRMNGWIITELFKNCVKFGLRTNSTEFKHQKSITNPNNSQTQITQSNNSNALSQASCDTHTDYEIVCKYVPLHEKKPRKLLYWVHHCAAMQRPPPTVVATWLIWFVSNKSLL